MTLPATDGTRRRPARFASRAGSLLLLLPGLAILGFALVWPLLTMLGVSLGDRFPDAEAWTLEKYVGFLSDPYYLKITQRTFLLALTVTATTAVLGYPVAWYLARGRSRWRHLVFLGVISPLLVSIVVRTLGWTIILGNEGLVNHMLVALGVVQEPLRLMQSFWSVTVAMVHVLLPFMVLSITTVLGKIDPSLSEAASLLGAGPMRNFLQVTLPLSVQGIASGSVIVFCLTIGAYVTPLWLGRGQVQVLATEIHEQMIVLVDWPTGAAAGMILAFGTLVAILAYGLVIARHARR
jgi:putative spermidine/putrescine transport system permease protein